MLILLNVLLPAKFVLLLAVCRSFSGLLCDVWQPVVHDSSTFSLICAFVKYLCAEVDRRHLLLVHFMMSHAV